MMKKIVFVVVACLFTGISFSQTTPELYRQIDTKKMNQWADSIFDTLSQEERIGQLFMPVVNPTNDAANKKLILQYIQEYKVGGFLFQKGNPITQAEVTNLMQSTARTPLLISLDGEWGLSMRLENTTRFPKNMMLGAIEDVSLIEAYGEEVARQCNELGIHINFAPVLDVNSNVSNPVIGLRSFGESPEAVAEKGIAYSRGLEKKGVMAVAKHFPGHGDTSEDSHNTLPVIRHGRERLDTVELWPFKRYIYEGFAGMMTGHLQVPVLDRTPNRAASFSQPIVTGLLKEELGFQGLCFTDALAMKGATAKQADNPSVLALLAGNDILLAPASIATDYNAVKAAVQNGTIDIRQIEEKCLKVLRYKYVLGLNRLQRIQLEGLNQRLNTSHAAWLTAKLNAEAITLLKNDAAFVPIKGVGKKRIAALAIGDSKGNTFQQYLNKYDKVDCFSIARNAPEAEVKKVYSQLANYDLIIASVHTSRIPESESYRRLAANKEMVQVFFTLPYSCRAYRQSLQQSKAVVMAYEATPLAMGYAAQLLFGGIAAKGKLPVTIPDLYFAGTGLFTEKCRLGYFEPKEVGINSTRLQLLDEIVEEGLQEEAYPGCQLLVAKEGMIIYNKSFGHFDYERKQAVTEQSVYDLASVTKATGTLLAVMKAYDEKLFTLNNKIGDFLPQLKGTDKNDLTIRELLYHQSGLIPTINFYLKTIDKESYAGSLYSNTKKATHPVRFDAKTWVRNDFGFLPELVSKTKQQGYTLEAGRDFYIHESFQDSIIQGIIDSKLRNRGKYAYSCINFILLKRMVEQLKGTSMDRLLRSDFYNRLGAHLITYNPLQTIDIKQIVPTENDQYLRRQLLRGHVHDEAAAFQGGVSGNAGLFSNAGDLAKVLQMYLYNGSYGGEQLLSPETTKLFTQSKSPTSRRGLGFDKPHVGNPGASPCSNFAPASTYGHTGYTGTCFWVDPSNQLIYILLTNRVNPTRINSKFSTLDIRIRLQDAIYKAMLPEP